jgi:hypothetical protein
MNTLIVNGRVLTYAEVVALAQANDPELTRLALQLAPEAPQGAQAGLRAGDAIGDRREVLPAADRRPQLPHGFVTVGVRIGRFIAAVAHR